MAPQEAGPQPKRVHAAEAALLQSRADGGKYEAVVLRATSVKGYSLMGKFRNSPVDLCDLSEDREPGEVETRKSHGLRLERRADGLERQRPAADTTDKPLCHRKSK